MSQTLYLEADEDITSAVDKLKAAEGNEISIVVPKRSTLLQSMINLKLLKKAADKSKKTLVLVTTDRLSSHLAGRTGLAVAAKLGADAKVPETEMVEPDQTEEIDGGMAETGSPVAKAAVLAAASDKPEPVEPGDEADDSLTPAEAAGAASPIMKTKAVVEDEPKSKPEKTKGAKVPDFNAMQKRMMWVALGVAVVIAALVTNFLITSAKVVVFAKGSQLPVTATFTADPAATTDIPKSVLKAQALTSSKNLTQQVPATGTQDVGTKATGTITVSNCYDTSDFTLPAGTVFSSGGKQFTSNSNAVISHATGNFFTGCTKAGTGTVNVTASENGDSYNLGAATYSVAGYPNSASTGLVGQGSQMSGGVSKTVTVVQQSDIDKAVADMLAGDKSGGQADLAKQAASGNQMIAATLVQTPSAISSDAPVGAQAANINVKVTAGYTALAITTTDLDKFLSAQALKTAGASNQVYDSGASTAAFTVAKPGTGAQAIGVTATAAVGPKIDTAAIANQIKGKKYGDALDLLNKLPGVDHATITITPTWSTHLPKRTGRIHISIKVIGAGG